MGWNLLPNPTESEFTIDITNVDSNSSVRIFDTMGHSIYSGDKVYGSLTIDHLPKGNYFVQIMSDEFSITRKLIVL